MTDSDTVRQADSEEGRETTLGKWLAENRLSAYVATASRLGFYDWPDLGGVEADVQACAEAIIQDKSAHPGDYNRIVNGWRAWKAKGDAGKKEEENKSEEQLLDLPSLPAHEELDLSAPTVTIDDVTYKIPTELGSANTKSEVWHADALSDAEWLVLARRTRLLFGMRVDDVFGSGVAEADESALVWRVPDSTDFVKVNDDSEIRSDLSYTSDANSRARNQMIEAHASLRFPYVSASAKAARDEKSAHSDVRKRLRMTGQWYFPRATVNLDLCTALSSRFLDAIKQALAVPPGRQLSELDRVFHRFGTAYPRQVDVGGSMYFVSERDTTGEINQSEVTRTLQGAISVKAGLGGGEAGASFQDGAKTSVSAQEIAETTQFTATGGDTTLGANPSLWQGTVKNANTWRIIGRRNLASLVDRLPDEAPDRLRSSVQAVWDRRVRVMWDAMTPPKDYVHPETLGRPFTITDVQGRPLGHTVPDLPGPAGGLSRGAKAGLGEPYGQGLLWRLFYTGETTEPDGYGQAKYWIVAYDRRVPAPPKVEGTEEGLARLRDWRTAIFPALPFVYVLMTPDREGLLTLVHASRGLTSDGRPHPAATFTLTPADPGGARGERFRDAYVIRRAGSTATMVVSGSGAHRADVHLPHAQAGENYFKFCCWCRPVVL